ATALCLPFAVGQVSRPVLDTAPLSNAHRARSGSRSAAGRCAGAGHITNLHDQLRLPHDCRPGSAADHRAGWADSWTGALAAPERRGIRCRRARAPGVIMPKKKQQFVALFHLQWKTAKATVPPDALKRCDFSKRLGPLLDTLEKKWDAAADLDPVPPKTLSDLKVQVEKFQKVVTGYRDEIVKANAADPGNGPGWFALRNALSKIDEGVVMDMK